MALRLARVAADRGDRSEILVLQNEFAAAERSLDGLRAQLADLVIRAPFDGSIRELDTALHPGLWLSKKTPLARLVGQGAWELRGYVAENDLRRLAPGAEGVFVPDDPLMPTLPARIETISTTSAEFIDIPALASTHEGPIAVAPEQNRALRPLEGAYATILTIAPAAPLGQEVRGGALIQGIPESYAARIARQVLAVLIRESGA